jgi:arsenate reductase (glutaredoxin)
MNQTPKSSVKSNVKSNVKVPLEVQIFGLKKSSSTRKAERFFKERRFKIHMVDLLERPIAKGEVTRFAQKAGGPLKNLLETRGKTYQTLGLEHMIISEERLLEHVQNHPDLLILPLVRFGKNLSIGEAEETWKGWLEG